MQRRFRAAGRLATLGALLSLVAGIAVACSGRPEGPRDRPLPAAVLRRIGGSAPLVAQRGGFTLPTDAHRALAVTLPARNASGARLVVRGGAAVTIRPLDHLGRGRLEGGHVLYDAEDGVRTRWVGEDRGVESWLTLPSPRRGVIARYVVSGARLVESHGEVYLARSRRAIVRIDAERAYDARGHAIGVSLHVHGQRLELSLDGDGVGPVRVDPSFAPLPKLDAPVLGYTQTRLADGRILIAGGDDSFGTTQTATLLYDPAAQVWAPGPSFHVARKYHSTTVLEDGRVLVVGGEGYVGNLADIWDPVANPTASYFDQLPSGPSGGRSHQTATRLANGDVLLVGGYDATMLPASNALRFDPCAQSFVDAGSPAPRVDHTATLLPSGDVLVVGGQDGSNNPVAMTELFDLVSQAKGSWVDVGNLSVPRWDHTATLLPDGTVLVAGGSTGPTGAQSGTTTVELFHPSTNKWSAVTATATGALPSATSGAAASLLPDGSVLIAGGLATSGSEVSSTLLRDPTTGIFSAGPSLPAPGPRPLSTVLPGGRMLVTGLDGATTGVLETSIGTFAAGTNRSPVYHGAVARLLDGSILTVGGETGTAPTTTLSKAFIQWSASTGSWGTFTPSGPGIAPRRYARATLLLDGTVLISGGEDGTIAPFSPLNEAYVYDPATGNLSQTGSMHWPRSQHTATLLPSGKVLVTGGGPTGSLLGEVYDPGSGQWADVTGTYDTRAGHVAVRLPDGDVVVAGGHDPAASGAPVATAFRYHNGAFLQVSPMSVARDMASAVLLPTGRMLVVGGTDGANALATAEIYDPGSQAWTAAGTMSIGRIAPAIATLADGEVLVAGGSTTAVAVKSTDVFDPVADAFQPSTVAHPTLSTPLLGPVAFRTANGQVRVFGGGATADYVLSPPSASAQLFLMPPEQALVPGQTLWLSGGGQGAVPSPGDGTRRSSGEDVPRLRFEAWSGGDVAEIPLSSYGGNRVEATLPADLDDGFGWLSLEVAGARSPAVPVEVAPVGTLPLGADCGAGSECSSGSCVGGICQNGAGTGDPNGTVCSTASTCASGFCVDGVCCEGACNGGYCDATGTCQAVSPPDGGVCTGSRATGWPCAYGFDCQSGACGMSGACCAPGCSPVTACDTTGACIAPDGGTPDGGTAVGDAGTGDAGTGTADAGTGDAGTVTGDAGAADAGATDAGSTTDAGSATDAGGATDGGTEDAGASTGDGGTQAPHLYGCVCGQGGSGSPGWLVLVALGFLLVGPGRRRRTGGAPLGLLLVAGAAAGLAMPARAAGSGPPAKTKVAVLDLQAGPGVDKKLASLITGSLTDAIGKRPGVDVMSMQDVQAELSFDAKKQLFGCNDDSACLAQIGGALGVDEVVSGTLGRVGSSYIMTLRLLDIRGARVRARFDRRVRGGTAEAFLDFVAPAARALFPGPRGETHTSAPAGFEARGAAGLGLTLSVRGQAVPYGPARGAFAVMAGWRPIPALTIGVGGIVASPAGVYLRAAWVPWNEGGRVRPVIAVELPILFSSPSVSVGASIAPGLEVSVTRWLDVFVEVPLSYEIVAPAWAERGWVFLAGGFAVDL